MSNTTLYSCSDILGSQYSDSECGVYSDGNTTYYYYYPDDSTVQYLHETFPGIISPIKGVEDERFVNWMRFAGLNSFRKLYGKIDYDIPAGSTLNFNLTANYETASFGSSKTLVVSTASSFGSRNEAIGNMYLMAGCLALTLGFLLASFQIFKTSEIYANATH